MVKNIIYNMSLKPAEFIARYGIKVFQRLFPPATVKKTLKKQEDKIIKDTKKNIKSGLKKTGKYAAIGAGGTELGGGVLTGDSYVIDPALEYARNKLKMNKGGIVKKRANKSKANSKSVAKKYFKGTF